jgi:hypothetical protein
LSYVWPAAVPPAGEPAAADEEEDDEAVVLAAPPLGDAATAPRSFSSFALMVCIQSATDERMSACSSACFRICTWRPTRSMANERARRKGNERAGKNYSRE